MAVTRGSVGQMPSDSTKKKNPDLFFVKREKESKVRAYVCVCGKEEGGKSTPKAELKRIERRGCVLGVGG